MNFMGDVNEPLVSNSKVTDIMSLDELFKVSWQARKEARPPVFETVYPSGTVPVSVTGHTCSLQCPHCGGTNCQRQDQPEEDEPEMDDCGCGARGEVNYDDGKEQRFYCHGSLPMCSP